MKCWKILEAHVTLLTLPQIAEKRPWYTHCIVQAKVLVRRHHHRLSDSEDAKTLVHKFNWCGQPLRQAWSSVSPVWTLRLNLSWMRHIDFKCLSVEEIRDAVTRTIFDA